MQFKPILGALLLGAICFAMPAEVQAQGGRWDWIQKMSGPGYRAYNTIGFAIGYCLNASPKIIYEVELDANGNPVIDPETGEERLVPVGVEETRCFEAGTGPTLVAALAAGNAAHRATGGPSFPLGAGFIDRPAAETEGSVAGAQQILISGDAERPDWEWIVGFGVSGGWNGTNDDNGIEGVNMLVLEQTLQVVRTDVWNGGPYVAFGLGIHRFWAGTAPEPFWNTALIGAIGYRFELMNDRATGMPRLFLTVAAKGRYFFDRMDSASFGGSPDPDDGTGGGEFADGVVFGFGWRFSRITGS